MLRATVARVATLEQVARVGGLPVPALVGLVRSALGLGPAPEAGPGAGPTSQGCPSWFREEDVRAVLDAADLLASGGHPLAAVRRALEALPPAAVVELRSDFEPAPLLERMRSEGIEAACVRDGDRFRTVLRR